MYILNPNKPPQVIPIENEEPEVLTMIDRVGVNHATTATCFCDIHDDEVFAPIEKEHLLSIKIVMNISIYTHIKLLYLSIIRNLWNRKS